MRNSMTSLSSLFNNAIFRIPDYQRGYAWDNSQLNDFWDDLYNLTDDRYHYTGMLSLKELSIKDCYKWEEDKWILENGYRAYHVVDGQQRLTTFIILLNSILELSSKNGIEYLKGKSIEEIRKQFIVEVQMPLKICKSYKFGYENDNPSFKYLRYKILGEPYSGEIEESFYTLNLQNAKDFFDRKLGEVYAEKSISIIENLYIKLVNKLQFNIHDIDDDFDVFIAFETMNNRGKKLSNLEILKNRLIYLTTIYPESILGSNSKSILRDRINETWREVYHQLGRNKNKPLDDDEYLRNHWTLFYKYTRNKGDDYIQFLLNKQFTPKAVYGEQVALAYKNLEEYDDEDNFNQFLYENEEILHPTEISDYVNSLKEVAQYWYISNNPDDATGLSDEEKRWINRLNHVGINYFRTLVVASLINKEISSEERFNLYKTIEKFIFLCFRLAKYNANYNSVKAYTFAREIYFNEIKVSEVISFFEEEFNKNVEGALNAFKAGMEHSFKNEDGFYSWYPRWYFLFEYEAHLSEGRHIRKLDDWRTFTKSDKDKISIEHIFPQKPTAYYWRNAFRLYQTEDEQHRLANSLGNLLALSQSINSALQNDEFALKKEPKGGRRGYAEGSYSEMEVSKFTDWTPQEILKRGLHLLTFMEERWGFKFPSEEFKIEVLGLKFLKEEREDIPELEEVDFTSRDTHFSFNQGEIKVSEFLKTKDLYMVKYYDKIFNALLERIPSLYETATKHYIALRCSETNKILAEVHIQNSKRKILIQTKPPKDDSLNIGEVLPDNYLWSLNYRIFLNEEANYSKLVELLVHVLDLLTEESDEMTDEEQELKNMQIQRSNKMQEILRGYEKDGKIVVLTKARRYTRFASVKIRGVVGLLGDESWSGIKDLVVYEINNRYKDCWLSLYVGPGSQEDRNKWIDWAASNSKFNIGGRGDKWRQIYSIPLFESLENEEQAVDKFKSFMEGDFTEIDSIF